MQPKNSWLTQIALILLGALFPLMLYEIYLRAIGYQPLSPRTQDSIFKYPFAYRDDSLLGWRLNPGSYIFKPASSRALKTAGRILLDESRATSTADFKTSAAPRRVLIFVGDSFTYGDGLNDFETYPWVVQQLLPDSQVINMAVPGYGTCQVFLQLRQLLKERQFKAATVIYGMSEFHESRNLPDRRIAWVFAALSTTKSYRAPSCLLDNNGQVQHSEAKPYFDPLPFLTENFSVGRRFVHFYYDLMDLPDLPLKRPLSHQLLHEINQLVERHNMRFMILTQRFTSTAQGQYEKFFLQNGIQFFNGSHPQENDPEMQLVGDSHPNAKMNRYWGELIARTLSG